MSEYRKIYFPKCPYCGHEVSQRLGDYDYGTLVGMATGSKSSDVILKCKNCAKRFRVKCSIKYSASKVRGCDTDE